MRKSLLGLVVAGFLTTGAALPVQAQTVKFMIPANAGGGYDGTGRTLGKALIEAGGFKTATYENKAGAGGTLGLAQFANANKGDPNALLVMGAIMVTGVIQAKPQLSLADVTPIARLISEYNVFVVKKDSPIKDMKELVALLKKDPGNVKWAGGSKGSTDHIGIIAVARDAGVDSNKVNYVPFGGGGEVVSALLGGHVTVATGGWAEMLKYVQSGQMRALAVTSLQRLPGVNVPTLKEQGIDVEIANWRGVYGAPGLTPAQRKELTDKVVAATRTKTWQAALKDNVWSSTVITGDQYGKFVDDEHSRLRAMLVKAGLF